VAKVTTLTISRGPTTLEIAAALFGEKDQNTEFSIGALYPKAIFHVGRNPEQLAPCHVTVRSVTAIGDWGESFTIEGMAQFFSVAPIMHGGTTSDEKLIGVTITYVPKTGKGKMKLRQ